MYRSIKVVRLHIPNGETCRAENNLNLQISKILIKIYYVLEIYKIENICKYEDRIMLSHAN